MGRFVSSPYLLISSVFVVFPWMLLSCKDTPSDSGKPDTVAKIEINADQTELWVDDTLQLTVSITAGSGRSLENCVVLWASDHPEILEINAQGLVRALKSGSATIMTTCENASGTLVFDIYTYSLIYEGAKDKIPGLFALELNETAEPFKLTDVHSFSFEPTPSPDGKLLVYSSMDTTTFNIDLHLFYLESKENIRLTADQEIDDMPAWSPDGGMIAFRSEMEQRFGDIIVYDLVDQSLTNLTDIPGVAIEDRQPAWSPDGAKIAYSSNITGNMDLWIMDANGSNKQQITSTEHYDTEAVWSPDGAQLLFRRGADTGSNLMIYNLVTDEFHTIALPGYQRMPAWSPDGRWIAFVSHPTLQDRPEIFMMRPDGSDMKLITRELSWGGGQNPAFIKKQ